jgi:hypothetical protein
MGLCSLFFGWRSGKGEGRIHGIRKHPYRIFQFVYKGLAADPARETLSVLLEPSCAVSGAREVPVSGARPVRYRERVQSGIGSVSSPVSGTRPVQYRERVKYRYRKRVKYRYRGRVKYRYRKRVKYWYRRRVKYWYRRRVKYRYR